MLGTTEPRKVSNKVLVIIIVVFAAVGAVLASTGVFDKSTAVSSNENASVNYKFGDKEYTYFVGQEPIKYIKKEKAETYENRVSLGTAGEYAIEKNGDVFNLVNSKGEKNGITLENMVLSSALLSADSKYILVKDTGDNLYSIKIREGKADTYVTVDENVLTGKFTGQKNDIVYVKKDNSLCYSSGGYKNQEETFVKKVQPSSLDMNVFYINNVDSSTDMGTLVMFNVGKKKEIDTGVYDIKFENGLLFYIKNFDSGSRTGDLYYFDGKNTILTNVKAEEFFD